MILHKFSDRLYPVRRTMSILGFFSGREERKVASRDREEYKEVVYFGSPLLREKPVLRESR